MAALISHAGSAASPLPKTFAVFSVFGLFIAAMAAMTGLSFADSLPLAKLGIANAIPSPAASRAVQSKPNPLLKNTQFQAPQDGSYRPLIKATGGKGRAVQAWGPVNGDKGLITPGVGDAKNSGDD